MSFSCVGGTTDYSVVIRIIDSSNGTPEEAVEHDSGGIALWYRRDGTGAKTAITPAALASLETAHSDGGIEHIDDGYYRLDLPDAAVAANVKGVMIGGTVTGMIVIGCYVRIMAVNLDDSVRGGMTALPNAAADAAGGLPISDAGGLDLDTILGRITGNVALASVLGALADAAADGDPTESDTLMKYIKQLVNILVGSAGIASFPSEAAPDNAVSLAEVIRAIHADVTGLNGSAMRGTDSAALASAWTAALATALGNYTAARAGYLDELGSANIPADVDTLLSRLSAARAGYIDELAAANIPADVDTLKTYCDILDHATNGLANIKSLIDTIDTVVDAIKAKTDNQPAGVPKGVEYTVVFFMALSSDHVSSATSKTITVQVSKDGGSFAGSTNSASEIGSGWYKVTLTATEMDATVIAFKATETDCDQTNLLLSTST